MRRSPEGQGHHNDYRAPGGAGCFNLPARESSWDVQDPRSVRAEKADGAILLRRAMGQRLLVTRSFISLEGGLRAQGSQMLGPSNSLRVVKTLSACYLA